MAGATSVTKYTTHTPSVNQVGATYNGDNGQTDPAGFLTHVSIATPSNTQPLNIFDDLADLPVP